MKKHITVKARIHHGAKSMDITIPSAVCKQYNINEGDLFTVDVILENETVKLVYTRIFAQK